MPPTPPVPKTPDLMGVFARPAARKPLVPARGRLVAASAWDAPPKRLAPKPSHGLLCAV